MILPGKGGADGVGSMPERLAFATTSLILLSIAAACAPLADDGLMDLVEPSRISDLREGEDVDRRPGQREVVFPGTPQGHCEFIRTFLLGLP